MNWTLALPELALALCGLGLLLAGVIPKRDTTFAVSMGVLGSFLLAAVLVLGQAEGTAFNGQYVADSFAVYAKLLILAGSAFGLIMAMDWNVKEGLARFEFPLLLLFATIGMMILVSANDLMTLYIGLELLSLSLYVIAAFNRDSGRSAEAGLKYFVLGALASGLLLYGSSLVYGFAGTTNFDRIADAMTGEGPPGLGIIIGLVFVVAAICFKVSAVPFHMWTPDVYEGAPTPVTAFFASAPKIAAVALLTRVLYGPFGEMVGQWQQVIVLCAILSMALGSFAAIGQSNIKRLMAYSSIGHVGYALMGIATGGEAGVRGALVYLAIYLFMNVGAFSVLIAMRRNGRAVEGVNDLAGLGKTDPAMAGAMTIFMFSMAGIPPLAGFWGKFFVIGAAIQMGFITMAVVGVLASVISAYYYLRIIKVMFFDTGIGALDPRPTSLSVVLGATALFTTCFIAFPGPLVAAAQAAVAALIG